MKKLRLEEKILPQVAKLLSKSKDSCLAKDSWALSHVRCAFIINPANILILMLQILNSITSRENPIPLEITLQEILHYWIVKRETKDLSKIKYIICIFHQNNHHGYAQ